MDREVVEMPQNIVELYTAEEIARLERRVKRVLTALIVLGAAALIACITLAALANVRNAGRLELAAVIVSTVAGWVCIYGGVFGVSAGKKEIGHANMLRSEPRERIDGPVTVTGERLRIRGSITVRRVEVASETGKQRVLVHENRAERLACLPVTAVYTAHGYVAAVEVAE